MLAKFLSIYLILLYCRQGGFVIIQQGVCYFLLFSSCSWVATDSFQPKCKNTKAFLQIIKSFLDTYLVFQRVKKTWQILMGFLKIEKGKTPFFFRNQKKVVSIKIRSHKKNIRTHNMLAQVYLSLMFIVPQTLNHSADCNISTSLNLNMWSVRKVSRLQKFWMIKVNTLQRANTRTHTHTNYFKTKKSQCDSPVEGKHNQGIASDAQCPNYKDK